MLKIDNNICYDPVTIADHVNSCFVNIGNKLVEGLPKLPDVYSAYTENCKRFYSSKGLNPSTYSLKEVDRSFVLNQLLSLKRSKSTGLDNIGPRFLRDGAEALADVITYIINLSICNKAKVLPLHKKNSKLEVGNYRPVSVLKY